MDHVEEQGASVVLVGNFNPAIFNPDWLFGQEILPKAKSKPTIQVIHPEVAQFEIDGLRFEILPDRFTLTGLNEPFVRVADVVADLFGEKLRHTPITTLVINYFAHFRVAGRQQQMAFGRALAPISPWGDWGRSLEGNSEATAGGLATLSMQTVAPPGRKSGHAMVTIQPSARLPKGVGVFMLHNDQFGPLEGKDKPDFAELCLKEFVPSLHRARTILQHFIDFSRRL